jgi:hypothetical protein
MPHSMATELRFLNSLKKYKLTSSKSKKFQPMKFAMYCSKSRMVVIVTIKLKHFI